ncbi:MAG TPA: hypothetical protein VNP97_06045 [Microbacterium sp.]|jgi:hypothetical protein|nr:hypothetical protein [Microbacterium sp.]
MLDPAAALALLDDQRRSIVGQIASFVPAVVLAWGFAWLLGFIGLWLIDGLKPAFSLPLPIAIGVFVVLLAAATAVSVVLPIRSGRGIRGSSSGAFTGAVYGMTWMLGSLAIVGFAQGLEFNGMDPSLANIFYPVAFALFAGIMYVLAGGIWHAPPMIVLGVWTVIVGVAAPFFGYPTHYLVLAIGGGLGFLVLGIASFVHLSRLRRRVANRAAHRG